MQLGMIGLGRMGSHMVQRLMQKGIDCVVHDADPIAMAPLHRLGATTADSFKHFVTQLSLPRVIWLMVPAAVVDTVLSTLLPLLSKGDIVIDGGNSYYHDDLRRNSRLKAAGIHYVDVGTSGGVFGLERGYCLMIGGELNIVNYLDPIFSALAPGKNTVDTTAGRENKNTSAEQGYLYCGSHGAGHFVKMVHNGIEYGMMAAYAEGMNILKNANTGISLNAANTEATPLRNPEYYQYTFDLPEIAEVWRRGSVISSWLLDLTANALQNDPDLSQYDGYVSDSGEGRWAIRAALDEAVPTPVLSAAVYARFNSRHQADFANKILSAMRQQFGGHLEPPDKK